MTRRVELIAFLLSLAAVIAAGLITQQVFEGVPHVEDEMAYVWQARAYAGGQLTVPTPPDPHSLWVPFVVDKDGRRFAKYPPGWPMVLALGILLNARAWVNPLLAGAAVWLTFRLGQKISGNTAGLLAAGLTLTSPLFLINSASLDSEPFALALSLAFALAWLETFDLGRSDPSGSTPSIPRWLTVAVAGLSLGLLALTRPLTAVAVALPFIVHGLVLVGRAGWGTRLWVAGIGALALGVGALLLVWQYRVTGNPLTDPYTLWWSFDRIGFGAGIGRSPGGHTLLLGLGNAGIMLAETARYLFGWGIFSWLFLPFGLWAVRHKRAAWLAGGIFLSLVVCYIFYWAWVGHYGPRYYYEGLPGLALISAEGILWLARQIRPHFWMQAGSALVAALTLALVGYNLAVSLPGRLNGIYGLYSIHSSQLKPFQTPKAQALTPALVFVHVQGNWTEYGGLLELENPRLTSPFIFAWSMDAATDAAVARDYPGRQVIQYFPNLPEALDPSPP